MKSTYLVAKVPYTIMVEPKLFVIDTGMSRFDQRHQEVALKYEASPGERLCVWLLGSAKPRFFVMGATKSTIYTSEEG